MRGGGTVCQVCGIYLPLDRPPHLLTVERGADTLWDLKLCISCVDEAEARIGDVIDRMRERVA